MLERLRLREIPWALLPLLLAAVLQRVSEECLSYRHSKTKKTTRGICYHTWDPCNTYGIPKAGFLVLDPVQQEKDTAKDTTSRESGRESREMESSPGGVSFSPTLDHRKASKAGRRLAAWTVCSHSHATINWEDDVGVCRSTNETPNARRFRITHNLFQVFQLRRLVVCRDTRTPSHASVTSSPPLDSER